MPIDKKYYNTDSLHFIQKQLQDKGIFAQNFVPILSYKGHFAKKIVKEIGHYILFHDKTADYIRKKLFKIFVELGQNIAYYSSERTGPEKDKGIGTIAILEKTSDFYLFSLNQIKEEEKSFLIKRVNKINSFDKEGLRLFKRQQLELPDSKYGGANIGLIYAAQFSENPLQIEFFYNDKKLLYFLITVKIDKK